MKHNKQRPRKLSANRVCKARKPNRHPARLVTVIDIVQQRRVTAESEIRHARTLAINLSKFETVDGLRSCRISYTKYSLQRMAFRQRAREIQSVVTHAIETSRSMRDDLKERLHGVKPDGCAELISRRAGGRESDNEMPMSLQGYRSPSNASQEQSRRSHPPNE